MKLKKFPAFLKMTLQQNFIIKISNVSLFEKKGSQEIDNFFKGNIEKTFWRKFAALCRSKIDVHNFVLPQKRANSKIFKSGPF